MPGTGWSPSKLRAWAALAVTVAANVAILKRGPGHTLGPTMLFIAVACTGLAWLLWEQRVHTLIRRQTVLVVSRGVLVFACLQPPTESHDVWSYVMIGRTVTVHHANPYEHPSSAFRT